MGYVGMGYKVRTYERKEAREHEVISQRETATER